MYNDYVPTKITHLVMSELEVTSKVLLALTEGIHVITPQWLLDIEAKNDGLVSPLPNVSKYAQNIKKAYIPSILIIFKVFTAFERRRMYT